jgi:hypothetical protein
MRRDKLTKISVDHFQDSGFVTMPTKDNVTFYLPRSLHFLSYQSNRFLRRSDLHRKKILAFELS